MSAVEVLARSGMLRSCMLSHCMRGLYVAQQVVRVRAMSQMMQGTVCRSLCYLPFLKCDHMWSFAYGRASSASSLLSFCIITTFDTTNIAATVKQPL